MGGTACFTTRKGNIIRSLVESEDAGSAESQIQDENSDRSDLESSSPSRLNAGEGHADETLRPVSDADDSDSSRQGNNRHVTTTQWGTSEDNASMIGRQKDKANDHAFKEMPVHEVWSSFEESVSVQQRSRTTFSHPSSSDKEDQADVLTESPTSQRDDTPHPQIASHKLAPGETEKDRFLEPLKLALSGANQLATPENTQTELEHLQNHGSEEEVPPSISQLDLPPSP